MKKSGSAADNLRQGGFDVQLILGDVVRAEDSFFKINQQGVVLSPTERALCKARRKPSSIATRIIIRGESGTQYWENFTAENQKNAQALAKELHDMIFNPPYNLDSKSILLHNPLGGNLTIGTPMIYELVEIIRDKYYGINKKKKGQDDELDDNLVGSTTVEYMIWIRKLIWKMLSEKSGSLGLFPSIYFYNSGKFIQSAFLGMAALLVENDNNDEVFLPKFTKARKQLESFLIEHKVFLNQINLKYGSKERSYRHMKGFYSNLIDIINDTPDMSHKDIITELRKIGKYDFLNPLESSTDRPKSGKFPKDFKIYYSNKEEEITQPECKLCHGKLHPMSKSFDHIKKQEHEGGSDEANAQTTHLYCNMSRDKLVKMGVFKVEEAGA